MITGWALTGEPAGRRGARSVGTGQTPASPTPGLLLPGALWEYRYSGTEANFEPKSGSCGMGEPSRDRHSGVCRPLERGDISPGWVGEAGALLNRGRRDHSHEHV